jgi:hypothetical protein
MAGESTAAVRLPMVIAAATSARLQPKASSSSGAKTPRMGLKKTTAEKLVRQTVATTVQP